MDITSVICARDHRICCDYFKPRGDCVPPRQQFTDGFNSPAPAGVFPAPFPLMSRLRPAIGIDARQSDEGGHTAAQVSGRASSSRCIWRPARVIGFAPTLASLGNSTNSHRTRKCLARANTPFQRCRSDEYLQGTITHFPASFRLSMFSSFAAFAPPPRQRVFI